MGIYQMQIGTLLDSLKLMHSAPQSADSDITSCMNGTKMLLLNSVSGITVTFGRVDVRRTLETENKLTVFALHYLRSDQLR
jgi:hypothetical protein